MKIKTFIAVAIVAAIPLASLLITVGCESTKDYDIEVTPSYVDVKKVGQSVRLTAKGWSDYNWSIKGTEGYGSLSSTHGESIIYTARKLPTSSSKDNTKDAVIQTIEVTARNAVASSTSGSGTNSTTTVSSAYTGKATIRHLATTTVTETDDIYVTVTPIITDVYTVDKSVTLTAKGGSVYTWAITENKEFGKLSSAHGESVVYIVNKLPPSKPDTTNTVVVTIEATAINVESSKSFPGRAIIRHRSTPTN